MSVTHHDQQDAVYRGRWAMIAIIAHGVLSNGLQMYCIVPLFSHIQDDSSLFLWQTRLLVSLFFFAVRWWDLYLVRSRRDRLPRDVLVRRFRHVTVGIWRLNAETGLRYGSRADPDSGQRRCRRLPVCENAGRRALDPRRGMVVDCRHFGCSVVAPASSNPRPNRTGAASSDTHVPAEVP